MRFSFFLELKVVGFDLEACYVQVRGRVNFFLETWYDHFWVVIFRVMIP